MQSDFKIAILFFFHISFNRIFSFFASLWLIRVLWLVKWVYVRSEWGWSHVTFPTNQCWVLIVARVTATRQRTEGSSLQTGHGIMEIVISRGRRRYKGHMVVMEEGDTRSNYPTGGNDHLKITPFWAHLCILHGGLIGTAFCPSVTPSVWTLPKLLNNNSYLRKYGIMVARSLKFTTV